MRSLKRDITSSLLLCALALGIALAWGSPFISRASREAAGQPQAQQQNLQAAQAVEKPHPGVVRRVYRRLASGF